MYMPKTLTLHTCSYFIYTRLSISEAVVCPCNLEHYTCRVKCIVVTMLPMILLCKRYVWSARGLLVSFPDPPPKRKGGSGEYSTASYLASFPGPRPASRRLRTASDGKLGGGLGTYNSSPDGRFQKRTGNVSTNHVVLSMSCDRFCCQHGRFSQVQQVSRT